MFREQAGGLFVVTDVDAVCITTNGVVTKRGACVMGRGVAAQAKGAVAWRRFHARRCHPEER